MGARPLDPMHVYPWGGQQEMAVACRGRAVDRAELLKIVREVARRTRPGLLFTQSFDRPSAKRGRERQIAKSRFKKLLKTRWCQKHLGPMKGGRGGAACTRRSLSIFLGSRVGPLLARNAVSLMEHHFLATSEMVPSWVLEPKTLLGAGALSAENILNDQFMGFRTAPTSLADIIADFDRSSVVCKRFRRLLRNELARLQALRVSPEQAPLRDQLVQALQKILAGSDTVIEFLLCETHKLVCYLLPKSRPHSKYARRV